MQTPIKKGMFVVTLKSHLSQWYSQKVLTKKLARSHTLKKREEKESAIIRNFHLKKF